MKLILLTLIITLLVSCGPPVPIVTYDAPQVQGRPGREVPVRCKWERGEDFDTRFCKMCKPDGFCRWVVRDSDKKGRKR